MANRGPHPCLRARSYAPRVSFGAAITGALILGTFWAGTFPAQARAQKLESLPMDPSALRPPELKDHFLPDKLPEKPTIAPFAAIPLDPLDFASPNPVYIGHRFTMASLDFLDENHLLITFRVPGLIRRTPGSEDDRDEHNIKAVVLSIPSGAVRAQAEWVLHGRDRYVWPLKGGRFLLRDGGMLSVGDSHLQVKPFLSFPGPVLSVEMDPDEQYLVTNSDEPPPATKKASTTDDGSVNDEFVGPPDVVLRIFRSATGEVLNVSRVNTAEKVPINSQGILESLRGYSNQWEVALQGLRGGTTKLGTVVSQCMPRLDFVSNDELLATTCKPEGGFGLIGISTSGQMLWQDSTSGYTVWPIMRRSESGLRFLRETLAVTREIGTFWALDRTDVKAQRVRVFDAASGNVAFEATADPVLDAGGNAAISPSGRRVALLSNGQIQVFNLPPAPPLPPAAKRKAAP